SFYFNFYRPDINKDKIIGKVPGYKKLVYKNIYPNIDIEYIVDTIDGIKYSYILHPGADASLIKMNYTGATISKDISGNLLFSTANGEIKDYAPDTYRGNAIVPGNKIASSFKISDGSTVGFNLDNENNIVSETTVIDPWTVNPLTSGISNSVVCDIALDGSNNSIVDGIDETTGEQYIQKYNSAGALQWSLNTYAAGTVVNAEGDVAADAAGNIYTTNGLVLYTYSQYYNTCKFDPTGTTLLWGSAGSTTSTNNMYETWTIAYNCNSSTLLQSGGGEIVGGVADWNMAVFEPVNPATGAEGTATFTANLGEVLDSRFASNGYLYMLTCDSNKNGTMAGHNKTFGPNNKVVCVNPSAGYSTVFVVNTGYNFADGDTKDGISNSIGAVGYHGIGTSCNYLYTSDGVWLDQRNLNTGVPIKRITVPGGDSVRTDFNVNGGIVTDMCGNVYIGSFQTIYKYDENLNLLGSITGFPDMIYDMVLGNNGQTIYVCGGGAATSFVSAVSVPVCSGVTMSSTAATCAAAGTATATPTFCASPYTYSWNNGQTTQTATGLAGGSYTVTVTGSIDCQFTYTTTATVSVTPATPPVISASAVTPTICSGGSTGLNALGGTTYTWSPATGLSATTGASVTASPGTSQTYTVTGTTGSCNNTATVSVTVNTTPTVAASAAPATICSGNSTTITASGATTYSWNTGATTSSITVSPTTSTTYTVTGTTVGCASAPKTVAVTVNTTPTITASGLPTTICSGSSTTLTASGATTYSWNTGATTSSIIVSPTTSTTYTVTGTTVGCASAPKTVAVTVNPTPTITVIPVAPTICPGGNVTLTASGALTYSWNTGATTSSINVSPVVTTTYTVTGTSAGCPGAPQTDVVTVAASLNVTVNPLTPAICKGDSVVLNASGAATYTWKPGTGLSCTNCPNPTAKPAGTTTYTVYGASGGCSDSAKVTVTVNPTPTVSVTITGISAAICPGDTMGMIASGATTYTWSPSTGLNVTTGAYVIATPFVSTTYTVTGNNASGCSATASQTITVYPSPTVTVTPASPAICAGNTTTLTASGGTTYTWSPSTGLNTSIGSSVNANPSVTQTYTVIATGTGGCKAKDSVTVTVNPLPVISVIPPSP
ncbi:MAG TPA: hypothetical protein VNY36_08835, partial [Bacteroidia bacterium]|nr:hypothetical protein [Bacteroidia bacterium]